jgi:hypothetical protein
MPLDRGAWIGRSPCGVVIDVEVVSIEAGDTLDLQGGSWPDRPTWWGTRAPE